MSNPNINVLVGGPVQTVIPATYKTKVLKSNIDFASQVVDEDTKYVIRYDFVLNEDVTIPANCILEFDGGSLGNATGNDYKLNLQTSVIDAISYKQIFYNLKVYSTSYSPKYDATWFGFLPTNTPASNKENFERLLSIESLQTNNSLIIHIPSGDYVTNGISYLNTVHLTMTGDGQNKTRIRISETDTESLYLLYLFASYSRIYGITFLGNTINWSRGYVFSNPNTKLFALFNVQGFDIWIYDCAFNSCSNHGVFIAGSNSVHFENCRFTYNLGYGALVLNARGVVFNKPWAELNYMGGIQHSILWNTPAFATTNIVQVFGGSAENNGIYGIKGTVKNYKGEDFEYQRAFFIMDCTANDYFESNLEYNTDLTNNTAGVVKPLKYKTTTLAADTTVAFKDSQWNDFIVYKRNNEFNITFEKEFLAGDTIYIYDFQQNLANELTWEYHVEQLQYNGINTIVCGGDRGKIVIDDDLVFKNYVITGPAKEIVGIKDDEPHLVDFVETNSCPIDINGQGNITGDNPIFPTLGLEKNRNIWDPIVSRNNLVNPDGTIASHKDVWLYMFGRSYKQVDFDCFQKMSGVNKKYTNALFGNPNGDFCVEMHLGDISDEAIQPINQIQVRVGATWCYGVVLSEKRFPILNAGRVFVGRSNKRPTAVPIGYQYFDTQLEKPIYAKAVDAETGEVTWVDATGVHIN